MYLELLGNVNFKLRIMYDEEGEWHDDTKKRRGWRQSYLSIYITVSEMQKKREKYVVAFKVITTASA